jgi:uncharacterized OB-fold protein
LNLRTPRFITAHRCPKGCLWLHEHEDCPDCGGRLKPVRINNEANVVSDTVVRVNPSGSPIHLGVARTTTGATTLCIIQGQIRGNGRDKVRLVVRDGRFHAITGRPHQRANREDYKRS